MTRETDSEVADLRAIMQTAAGRRWMWRFLGESGIFRSSFTGNSKTFFLEGQRNIGLWALAELNEHCLDLYTKMVGENHSKGTQNVRTSRTDKHRDGE